MPAKRSQLSRWTRAVKVVISRSTCESKLAAMGKRARLTSAIVRAREPASLTIAAARAARPSFPFGSWAEPTANSSFTSSCGSFVRCTSGESATASPVAGAGGAGFAATGRSGAGMSGAMAIVSREGIVAIASGSASFESVVWTRPASTKYLRAAAWTSAGVTAS